MPLQITHSVFLNTLSETTRMKSLSVSRGLLLALTAGALTSCGTISSMMEGDRIDYKSAGKAPSLQVPPDLTQLQRDNRYAVPQAGSASATASSFAQQQQGTRSEMKSIAPKSLNNMRIERLGNQRWMVVAAEPEALWPQLKEFWQSNGFLLNVEAPDTGVMETDWAENRAKLPQDFIRNTLGRVVDSLYSTGERDKFRTRLERGANGTTEIYISHRRMEEVLTGTQEGRTVWTPREANPELEAEFLARMMSFLGAEDNAAKAALASATAMSSRAKLVRGSEGGYVQVEEGFERAWRRVGLALDRVGFTVEDRDRAAGLYFVRYVDPELEQGSAKRGFLSRLNPFSSSDKDAKRDLQRYRVAVKSSGETSQVAVLDEAGRPNASKNADRILSLLNEQLR